MEEGKSASPAFCLRRILNGAAGNRELEQDMGTAAESADLAGKAIVLYDGECPLCRKSVDILKRLDWRHILHFQNARGTESLPEAPEPLQMTRLLEEMHLLTPDRRRVYHGFGAFRWMAWRLPLLAAFAPVFYLPGVPSIGQRVYLWVARNRYQLVPCHNGVCTVPQNSGDS
jgi:predicted DCC family thiol-disulfide oxidoreductase YuxK